MKNFLILVILFSIGCFSSAYASEVRLYGQIPEYAGEKIIIYTYSDYITYEEIELADFEVDPEGSFDVTVVIEETCYIYMHLGVYDGYVFIEPGKEYELLFPERIEKTRADKLNPYFEPTYYHLGVDNYEKGLNYYIAWFDYVYNQLLNSASLLIYDKSKSLDVDLELSRVDSIFGSVDMPFFNEYREYKYAMFRHISYQQKSLSISNSYYLNKEILYQNPAYMDLFNQVYDGYFEFVGRTQEGKIYKDINAKGSIMALKETLSQSGALSNDTLMELVMIKNLHEEFYDDQFSRTKMLLVLDSLIHTSNVEQNRTIAKKVRHKVTKLLVGYKPAPFTLYDMDSSQVSLDSLKGKYVYLGFCLTPSYACIQEFEKLSVLYDNHKNDFEIVTICVDDSFHQMKRFVEKRGYQWTFLHYGNQAEILKEYDIRAFPTYYFINPEGKLSMSPAPAPDENAEFKIFEVMRNDGAL